MGSYCTCALPGPCQRSRSLAQTKRIVGSGDENARGLDPWRWLKGSQVWGRECAYLYLYSGLINACAVAHVLQSYVFNFCILEMTSRIWRRYFISVQAKMLWRRLVKKEQIQLKCDNQNMQHFEI